MWTLPLNIKQLANETESWGLKEFVLMIAQEKLVILAGSRRTRGLRKA